MTQQEKEREAIHNASVKHILPLVGNHVTAEDLSNALDKIANTAIEVIDELRKPSEDLVQETTKLLSSSRSQENEVNKELLEAAKDALKTFYGVGCTDDAEIVQELKEAILNAEKQIR